MSMWDKGWVRGLTHVALAIGTGGLSIPGSVLYEKQRYDHNKDRREMYASGYLAGAGKKAEGDDGEGGSEERDVVYDGALAETELKKRKAKAGSLIGSGDDTFSGGLLKG